MKQPNQIVSVVWEDACSTDIGWTNEPDLECQLTLCRSVGWILQNTNERLSLVQNISHEDLEEHSYCHVINIPKTNIKTVHLLEPDIKVDFDISPPSVPA